MSVLILLFCGVWWTACSKSDSSPEPQPYLLQVPAGFPEWSDMPDNPMTVQGVELGRRLFYDKRLSGSNQISCASCHRQDLSFSDGVAFSNIGASGRPLHRHAPALINLLWTRQGLFWDGGSTNLESQAFAPLASEDEMHQDLWQLSEELREDPDYVRRFTQVFQDPEISAASVVKAIAQFERSLVSAGSRYDRYRQQESVAFSQAELRGRQLVQQLCSSCHAGELFTDNSFHNNGIDEDFSDESFDRLFTGRYRITQLPEDKGRFKTPTLRNLLLTAPYMHDGRFASLPEVLDHYQSGIKASATLDPSLPAGGLLFSKEDKQAILSFLATLTDSSFIRHKPFSNPF